MQRFGLAAAIVLLASVTLAPAFSEDGYQERDSSDSGYQDKTLSFDDYSNGTLVFGESNKTLVFGESNRTFVFGESNQTDIGQEISDYVHKRNDLEKQKRDDILSALSECRQSAMESANKTALQQCIDSMRTSRGQYRSYVSEQNLQFQQFRDGLLPQGTGENGSSQYLPSGYNGTQSQSHEGFNAWNHENAITPEQNKHALNQVISEISHNTKRHSGNGMHGNGRGH